MILIDFEFTNPYIASIIIVGMKNSRSNSISGIIGRAIAECLATTDASCNSAGEPFHLFNSPIALALKEEIIRAGKKLWERQYVDGNGGNISARLSQNYFLCTPTLCSKGDLQMEDISLVDIENRQICGTKAQTSEILLHLEIYKTVPDAKAVIHCHPPYATAYAIAGVIPQGNLVPEQEVFVGPVALVPYDTPGTSAFARTILPVARQHNTILLANHGIVCWADTVTHAEWFVEVIDNYCKTVMIASQLKSPLNEIPADKIADLLSIKKKLGLPDVRLPLAPDVASDGEAEVPGALPAKDAGKSAHGAPSPKSAENIEQLVSTLTTQVLEFLEKGA